MAIHILQYSIDGEFIKEWYSLWDIDEELDYEPSKIKSCCNNKTLSFAGYIWRYKNTEHIPKYIEPEPKSRDRIRILCYDLYGDFITGFKSVSEASRELGLSKSKIQACFHGKRDRVGSYMFKYEENLNDLQLKIEPYKGNIIVQRRKNRTIH